MTLKRIALTAVLFCFSFSIARAQFSSGIQGVVTDPTGSAVPDATVHVTNVETGVAREATTSNEGLYRVTNLGLERIAWWSRKRDSCPQSGQVFPLASARLFGRTSL